MQLQLKTWPFVEDYLKSAVLFVLVLSVLRDEGQLRLIIKLFLVAMGLYMAHSVKEFFNGRHEYEMEMHITTGRRLAAGFPADLDSVLVMLDAGLACRDFQDPDLYIHWGAYLGTPNEVLVAGRLIEVAAEIERVKQELRNRHGWIMDTYLLQRGEHR